MRLDGRRFGRDPRWWSLKHLNCDQNSPQKVGTSSQMGTSRLSIGQQLVFSAECGYHKSLFSSYRVQWKFEKTWKHLRIWSSLTLWEFVQWFLNTERCRSFLVLVHLMCGPEIWKIGAIQLDWRLWQATTRIPCKPISIQRKREIRYDLSTTHLSIEVARSGSLWSHRHHWGVSIYFSYAQESLEIDSVKHIVDG